MAKLKFKNPKTGLWEEAGNSLQNLKDGEKASLYMDNTNEVTTPAGGTTLHPNPTSSTTSPTATGTGSFAVGSGTKATGDVSTAIGILNEASGKAAHAEGAGTKAGGNTSHSEGFYTETIGDYSHAENYGTIASGKKSHAEGGRTKAIGDCTHAEGDSTTAQGRGSHAEGAYTFANGEYSHAEGCGNNFEGADQKLIAGGTGAHAEGFITKAMGDYSHAEGMDTQTSGQAAHAEGFNTTAINKSHAEGEDTLAGGDANNNRAAHAEGLRTTATGAGSHAEGGDTIASGRYSHAEGRKSTTGEIKTTASGEASHAEGIGTTASGYNSHSEGGLTTASGGHSHAEGYGTTASGKASHAGGTSTIAQWDNSTVVGKYNKTSNLSNTSSDPLFIVGNGTATDKSNAFEVYQDGTGYLNNKKILVEGDVDKAEMNAIFANALKTSISGIEGIGVSDVSPLTHTVTVKVRSKNIIPYPYVVTTKTDKGITWTDNGDGTVTANGTATGDSFFAFSYTVALPASGKYTLSGCPVGGSGTTYYIYAYDGSNRVGTDYGNGRIISMDATKTYRVYAMVANGATVNNAIFKPQLEYGITATAYTSYIPDLSVLTIYVRHTVTDTDAQAYTPAADGTVSDITSMAPDMTITASMPGVIVDATYNQDIIKAFAQLRQEITSLQQAIISMGGNV